MDVSCFAAQALRMAFLGAIACYLRGRHGESSHLFQTPGPAASKGMVITTCQVVA